MRVEEELGSISEEMLSCEYPGGKKSPRRDNECAGVLFQFLLEARTVLGYGYLRVRQKTHSFLKLIIWWGLQV